MPRTLLAVVLLAALALTALLVLGLLGEDAGGPSSTGDTGDRTRDETVDAHLQGTGVAAATADTDGPTWQVVGRVRRGDGRPLAGCRVGLAHHPRRGPDPRDPSTWTPEASVGWGAGSREDGSRIEDPSAGGFTPSQEVATDAEGRFAVRVPREGRYRVRPLVEPPRVGSQADAWVSPQRASAHVNLVVVDGAPLAGRVIDGTGRPVAAVVQGTVAGDGRTRWVADPVATDAADGAFGWSALPPGEGTFTVTLPGRLLLRGRRVDLPHEGVWTIRLDDETGAVAGRVLAGDGRAVAGARVLVDTAAAMGRAVTDAAGAWRAEGLPAGRIRRLVVEADGYGVRTDAPPLAPWTGATVEAGVTTTIDVVLDAGATLSGTVREVGSGRPLAGAEVFVLRRTPDRRTQPVPNTTTDAAGRYVLRGIRPGLHVLLARSATHHLPQLAVAEPRSYELTPQGLPVTPAPPPALTLLVSEEDTELVRDLELVRGITLRGRVVGPEDEPVGGASIETVQQPLSQAAWRWGVHWPGWGVPLAVSDEGGRFTVTGLPASASFPVRATKRPLTSGAAEQVELVPGEPTEELVLRLEPAIAVEGRVLGPDGEAIEAWINAWSTTGGGHASRATEADGSFRLEGLAAGGVRLRVAAEGYGDAALTLEPIGAGETKTGVEIRLRGGVPVRGVLVDQRGQGVASRSLTISRPDGTSQLRLTTDEDGRFATDHAPKGRLKASVARVQGGDGGWADVGEPFDSPVADLRLVLHVPEPTVVEGTVVDAEGRPVPICRVTIVPLVDGRPKRPQPGGFGRFDANEVVNGAFRREVAGEGPFRVEVSAPRGRDGRPLNLSGTVMRVDDPAAGPVELRLEPGVELVGRVVDPEDRGVQNVVVRTGSVMATTDADGRFRLGGLAEGTNLVQVTPPPGWVKPETRPVATDEALRIVLQPAAAVAGTVTDGAGRPAGEFVRIEATWAATDEVPAGRLYGHAQLGVFRIDGIPRGVSVHMVVTVYGTQGSSAPVAIDVEAGDEEVEIVVGGGPELSGQIVDEAGDPVVGASLTVQTVAGRSAMWVWSRTSEEGRFRVQGIEPGPHHVLVRRPGESTVAEVVTVTAPSETIRIRLAAARTVRGRLVGAEAGRAYRVRAWAEGVPDAEVGRTARVAGGETFVLEGLGRTRVVIGVRSGDRYAISEPLEPGTAEVELVLREGAQIAGTVVSADGTAAGAWVRARSETWSAQAYARDGRFELHGLPPGRYRLVALDSSFRSVGPAIEVAAGSTNVQLRLP